VALELDDTRSNREIARHLGVSDPFVGKIRSLHEQLATVPLRPTGAPLTLEEAADRVEQAAVLQREALDGLRWVCENLLEADPNMLLEISEKQEAAAALVRPVSKLDTETISAAHDVPLLLRVHRASEAVCDDLVAYDGLCLRLTADLRTADRLIEDRIAELASVRKAPRISAPRISDDA